GLVRPAGGRGERFPAVSPGGPFLVLVKVVIGMARYGRISFFGFFLRLFLGFSVVAVFFVAVEWVLLDVLPKVAPGLAMVIGFALALLFKIARG
nr:hypothetical protein [Micromonospora sp. DSM 115978]